MDDLELLAEFGRERSGKAFEEIVRRYTDLVYSAALRQTRNADEAEDVTQAVFVILSQKAAAISASTPLVGWLLTTTRCAAMNFRRAKFRRANHERKAAMTEKQIEQSQPSEAWKEIAPMLDAAMASLKSDQRDAVVLRYFQGQPFAAVATQMGISEDAAKKRVTRGVEKLRKFFERRGVAVPAAGLTGTIASHAVHAAPVHLATSCAVASKGSALLGAELLRMMMISKIKALAMCVIGAVVVGGTTVITVRQIHARAQAALPLATHQGLARAIPVVQAQPVELHGTVIDPDGKPAVGAVVYEARPTHPVALYGVQAGQPNTMVPFNTEDATVNQNGSVSAPDGTGQPVKTDLSGQFEITTAADAQMLVVGNVRGVAKVSISQFKSGDSIQLQPWAHIEGNVQVKDRKKIDPQVFMAVWHGSQNPNTNAVSEYQTAPIDAKGHFVFSRVAPGPVWIFTKILPKEEAGPSTFVIPSAGQNMTADIAVRGRTILGKFVTPSGTAPITSWRDTRHDTSCSLNTTVEDAMLQPSDSATAPSFVNILNEFFEKQAPANWANMTPQQQAEFREAWEKTPAGKGWVDARLPQSPILQPDGGFEFIGIKPGQYVLRLRRYELSRNGDTDDAASLITQITVPTDPNDEPLDLGNVPVTIEPMLRVKKPAPGLTAASLAPDGAPIHLSDYKGKYVLIYVWSAAEPNPDLAHSVDMFALDEAFGSNGKVALLGINHDSDLTAARAFVAASHLDHWVMTSAPEFNGLPEGYKHISGGAVLIGPDGNVIAKRLYGAHVASLLRRELAK